MPKTVFTPRMHSALHTMGRFLLALTFFFIAFGFTTDLPAGNMQGNEQWTLHKTIDNVEFYHMLANCDGKNVVLLKFNNKNNHKVKVSWKEVFTTQMEKAAEGYNGQKQLFIGPGETLATGCKDDKIKELVVYPEQVAPTYIVTILGFEFKDINVSLAQ